MSALPHELLGQIDIYLFDQLQRGRIAPGMRVLDAGCGPGRNIEYLLRAGFDVFACDVDERVVETVQRMARDLAPHLPHRNFRVEPMEAMSFGDRSMDVVIASAVLHFARDEAQWRAMVGDAWRVLSPGGTLFCRLASSIGMEDRVQPLGGRRFRLPDGSERLLVDEAMLVSTTAALGGTLLDPIKTTIVSGQRCMTTWVVRKPG
jgi:SAM-dependent methyltransferase